MQNSLKDTIREVSFLQCRLVIHQTGGLSNAESKSEVVRVTGKSYALYTASAYVLYTMHCSLPSLTLERFILFNISSISLHLSLNNSVPLIQTPCPCRPN